MNEEKIVHNLNDNGISPDATCKDCKKTFHGRKIIGKELQKALEYEWYPIESNLIPCNAEPNYTR